VLSRTAAQAVKAEGRDNPLMQLIAADPSFAAIANKLPSLLDPARFIGRAAEQVDSFVSAEIRPRLAGGSHLLDGEIRV
jgi:adenylosuccinate lyase